MNLQIPQAPWLISPDQLKTQLESWQQSASNQMSQQQAYPQAWQPVPNQMDQQSANKDDVDDSILGQIANFLTEHWFYIGIICVVAVAILFISGLLDSITGQIKSMLWSVGDAVGKATSWIGGAAGTVGGGVTDAVDWTKGAAGTVGGGVTDAVDWTGGAVGTIGSGAEDVWGAASGTIGSGALSGANAIGGVAGDVGGTIAGAVSSLKFW